jgi:hypothetical protein
MTRLATDAFATHLPSRQMVKRRPAVALLLCQGLHRLAPKEFGRLQRRPKLITSFFRRNGLS